MWNAVGGWVKRGKEALQELDMEFRKAENQRDEAYENLFDRMQMGHIEAQAEQQKMFAEKQTEIENLKAQICALGGEITEDNSKEIAASIDAGCEMAFEHLKQARRQLSHSVELMRSKVQEAVRDATRNAMRNAKLEEELNQARSTIRRCHEEISQHKEMVSRLSQQHNQEASKSKDNEMNMERLAEDYSRLVLEMNSKAEDHDAMVQHLKNDKAMLARRVEQLEKQNEVQGDAIKRLTSANETAAGAEEGAGPDPATGSSALSVQIEELEMKAEVLTGQLMAMSDDLNLRDKAIRELQDSLKHANIRAQQAQDRLTASASASSADAAQPQAPPTGDAPAEASKPSQESSEATAAALKEAEALAEARGTKIAELEERLVQLSSQLKSTQDLADSLQQSSAGTDEERSALMQRLTEAESRAAAAQKQISDVSAAKEAVEGKLKVAEAETETARSDVSKLRAQLAEMDSAGSASASKLQEELLAAKAAAEQELEQQLAAAKETAAAELDALKQRLESKHASALEKKQSEHEAALTTTAEEAKAALDKALAEAESLAGGAAADAMQKIKSLEEAHSAAMEALRSELEAAQAKAVEAAVETAVTEAEAKADAEKQKAVEEAESREKTSAEAALEALKSEHAEQMASLRAELASEAKQALEAAVAAARSEEQGSAKEQLEAAIAELRAELEASSSEALDKLRAEHAEAMEAAKKAAEAAQLEAVAEAEVAKEAEQEEALSALRTELEGEHAAAMAKVEDEVRTRTLAENEANLKAAQEEADQRVKDKEAEMMGFKLQYSEEVKRRRAIHNELMELKGNIRVFARCRPVLPMEREKGNDELAAYFPFEDEVVVSADDLGSRKKFSFDRVFTPESTQPEVFTDVQPMVVSAMDGYNVCIFAYGQTGSGKTFTMEGPPDNRGVNFRAIAEVFKLLEERSSDYEYTMKLSMLEIYNESVQDLLAPAPARGEKKKALDVRQGPDGVVVPDLMVVPVTSEEDVQRVVADGSKNRALGAHNMNEHSSRSHLVMTVYISGRNKVDGSTSEGKMHLIDLAGSERVGKTDAKGERLKEAQNINRSLSALGNVVESLANKGKHVPFRNSKLTFLLQDSLSGDSKVLMFVNFSPVMYNASETLCSLGFAKRCAAVQLGPAKKHGASKDLLRLKRLVDKYEAQLGITAGGGGGGGAPDATASSGPPSTGSSSSRARKS